MVAIDKIYKTELPNVYDLMEELEKKTRVPISRQKLIFKGQILSLTPTVPLQKFGVFPGSRIQLIGERVSNDHIN